MDAPEKIWAKAQEWPRGTGRIDAYNEYTLTASVAKLTAAAVALALQDAHDAIADYPRASPDYDEWTRYDEQIAHSQQIILALTPDPDALAKHDAAVRRKALEEVMALNPYDSDGDPAGKWDHHVFVKRGDVRALIDKEPTE